MTTSFIQRLSWAYRRGGFKRRAKLSLTLPLDALTGQIGEAFWGLLLFFLITVIGPFISGFGLVRNFFFLIFRPIWQASVQRELCEKVMLEKREGDPTF